MRQEIEIELNYVRGSTYLRAAIFLAVATLTLTHMTLKLEGDLRYYENVPSNQN